MIKKTLFIAVCFFSLLITTAQTSKKRSELERLKRATQEMIEETNKMLSDTKKSALQYLNQLSVLGEEIKMRKSLISTLNEEVTLIEREQARTNREIAQLQESLKEKKEKYAVAMQGLYNKRSGVDDMLFILSAQSVGQSYRRMRYLQEYSSWRKEQAIAIAEQQADLTRKREELDRKKKERNTLLAERRNETHSLQQKESTQKSMVSELEKKKKSLQAELKKQQQQAREFDREIQRLIEEEARKAAKQKDSKAATKGGYAMNKQESALSGSFEKNKGKLPYPINGSYIIVGRFGRQQHSRYVETINNGIDLQTKPGAEARAVFDGVVSRVFIVPGYNSSVIVRHGNYLTVYSNLREVYVKAGDTVKTRQSIGKIFTDTENGNLTKMQFQLWKETTKLNPEPWLAR
ncbi:MAG: peptidoglycan DD-metalloendopeptidase family protein [Bacteroidales bacterium]